MRVSVPLACLTVAILCAGCGSGPSIHSTASLTSQSKQLGHAQGGQQPITSATVQLWQVNTSVDGGVGTAMLTGTVTSSDGSGNATNSNANAGNLFNTLPAGYFTITNMYSCPAGDALVYITASGGNPGLAAGTNNAQSKLVAALGSCNNLKANVPFVNISEQTTVGTVAALYAFMSGYNAIGASPAHSSDLAAAFALVNEYIDFQAGSAPGPALPAGYSASTADLNFLANVLATCVNSPGGAYNDGSPCGNLFLNASASSSNPATDVTAAALYIRENDIITYGNIFSLPTPQAPFHPADTTPPPNWTLPIFQLPLMPTFSLMPGTYAGTQVVAIQDADPSAGIYYTFGGTPTSMSNPYRGPLTVSSSRTINAIAIGGAGRVSSTVASATYTITGTSNAQTVSIYSLATPSGSTAALTVQANSNANGSVVNFSTAGGLGGSFSPATCTIASGYCDVSYIPSGTDAAGSYTNDLVANFGSTGSYAASTATGTLFIVAPATLTTFPGSGSDVSLNQASDGYFYGVDNGAYAYGSIFRTDASGNSITIHTFTGGADGAHPQDRVIQGTDGAFYGVTSKGGTINAGSPLGLSGNGTIFRVTAAGSFQTLYSFTGSADGAQPRNALVQGTDGSFYGTTATGGAGFGTAFKVDSSGTFTLLHTFTDGADGGIPAGALLQGADGNFYDTTLGGGAHSLGTVFRMDTSGNVTSLYSFQGLADGTEPYGALVQGTDGSFYGTTLFGGTYQNGTVYKIDSSGNFTLLHGFVGAEGARPESALVQAADGNFYGTTLQGTVFKTDSSGNFTLFPTVTTQIEGGLAQGSDGSFYGAANTGSTSEFFKLTPSPAIAGPVRLTVPSVVTHSATFTLSYAVANAASKTMQQCFATNTGGDTTGWVGVKTSSISTTNVSLTAPATAGTYTYALTCGGVESGFVALVVDHPDAPVFTPATGTYYTTQSVTLTDDDPNAALFYTVNGATPTTSSTPYTAPVTVAGSEMLKAIAVDAGTMSPVATAAYVITAAPPPAVSLSAVTAISNSTAAENVTAYSNANGSTVTFGTNSPVDGSFSPTTCTIANGSCSVAYMPSGALASGTYASGLTASFAATTDFTVANASCTLTITAAPAFSVLYTFHGTSDGNVPVGGLTQASDGKFYGATYKGGASSEGTAYNVDTSGNYTPLHTFTGGADGGYPRGGMVEGLDGNFYGATETGGANNKGTIYQLTPAGILTTLYSFIGSPDGYYPQGNLTQATDGNFYGTASQGGSHSSGTFFRMTPAGELTLLYTFTGGADGDIPAGSLVQGADGSFYGEASYGGAPQAGTLFKIDSAGNFTLLHTFTNGGDGGEPSGGLAQGADGSFYGGANGTLFKVDSAGNFTTLFTSLGGAEPSLLNGLLLAGDGNFYGTSTYGGVSGYYNNPSYGELFRMDTSGNVTTLYSFLNGGDGEQPDSNFVQGSNGSLYGMASAAGASYSGTLFELTPSPTIPAAVTLTVPASVTHGTSFTLSYSVANAYSKTLQQCFATNTAGDTTGWTDVKTGSPTVANASLTAPATAGTYTYALTCGGTESGYATLVVN
jgi:uncharacterized repeat protein (TIGR03803 family)